MKDSHVYDRIRDIINITNLRPDFLAMGFYLENRTRNEINNYY
jgi:hypothetical protein